MNIKSRLSLHTQRALVCVLLTSGVTAQSQPVAKEGRYDYVACWSGASNVLAFSKTHTATTTEFTGTTRSNIAGSIFDNNSFRCIGMSVSFDGKNTASAACESIDRDGDRRLSYFATAADGKVTREVVSGTGKYDGLVLDTTVTPIGPFPTIKPGTFQACNHQVGSYKLK